MKKIKNIDFTTEKSIIEKVSNITVDTYFLDNGLDDHIILLLDGNYLIDEIIYNTIIIEREYATTWTNHTNVIFTNDDDFVNNFIKENDHEKIYI